MAATYSAEDPAAMLRLAAELQRARREAERRELERAGDKITKRDPEREAANDTNSMTGLMDALKGVMPTGAASSAGGFSQGGMYGGGFSQGGLLSGGFSQGAGASGASGASSGMGSGLAAMGPWAALAAAIALNENYQGNIGNREGEKFPLEYGITGRAFYKDAPGWGEKADKIIPGLGDGVRIAGNLSSPADLFRGETYEDLFDNLKRGGVVGGLLRKIF